MAVAAVLGDQEPDVVVNRVLYGDFRRVCHAGAFQHDQGGLVILYELRDAPGQVILGIATDAAAGQVEDLLGDRAGAWAIDADFPRFVHQHADLVALSVPEFEQAHEQGGLARAERSAKDVEGDRQRLRHERYSICWSRVRASRLLKTHFYAYIHRWSEGEDEIESARRMVKKAAQRGRSEQRGEAYSGRTVSL